MNTKPKINQQILEYALLFILFILLLFYPSYHIFHNSMPHEFPIGYLAGDSLIHLTLTEDVYYNGNLKNFPSYMVGGYEDIAVANPTLVYNVVSSYTNFSGLEPYDALILVNVLFFILAIFIMYIIIKRLDPKIAILSLPLGYFIFYTPFYFALLYGQFSFILGIVFLLGGAWCLVNFNENKIFLILALFLIATALAHPSEFVILLGLIFVFFIYIYIKRDEVKVNTKKIIYAVLLALLFSFHYINIFMSSYLKSELNLKFQYVFSGYNLPEMLNFPGIIILLLILGLILSIFYLAKEFKEKKSFVFLIGIYLLLITYTNFIGQVRAIQIRLMWPVLLMLFFGLAVKLIFDMVSISKIRYIQMLFTLTLIIFFFFLSIRGLSYVDSVNLDPHGWDGIVKVRENTNLNDVIFLFKEDRQKEGGVYYLFKRRAFSFDLKEDFNNTNFDAKNIEVVPLLFTDTGLPYKKSLFTYGSHLEDYKENKEISKKKFCDYNYLFIYKRSDLTQEMNKKISFSNHLLDTEKASLMFNNALVMVIKNNFVGGDCI